MKNRVGKPMYRWYTEVLVALGVPKFYRKLVVWWEFHSDLRAHLKALRILLMRGSLAARNAAFGTAMLVATRQIQSRAELRDMSSGQIMAAYRAGRLAYLMRAADEGLSGYGSREFHEWVKNGGQIHP